MLFNSLEFAVFFPFVFFIYYALPQTRRVPFLLGASCLFYMAFVPWYIIILFVTITIDFVGAILIEKSPQERKKPILVVSILGTCIVLFVFKYYNFFAHNIKGLSYHFGWGLEISPWNIILPIGLSFHTFQSLSYVIEVHRGRQLAERNFTTYATFVMFFPQLVAGPIERPQNLLHQFRELHTFDYSRIVSGLKRMAWGFFKKVVIADRLAYYTSDVFGQPQNFTGLQLAIGVFFFAYQIYCDFSGYSDIALGTAKLLGFSLMENFDSPYHSLSITEFWRRWHISLSTWLKDYVYFPLGGSRVAKGRWAFNVLVTFGISGLWHGANWTFIVWGLLNGVYLISGEMTRPLRSSFFDSINLRPNTLLRKLLMWASTFALTCFAWIFFRAQSLADAWYIITHLFSDWNIRALATQHFYLRYFPVAVLSIIVLELGEAYGSKWVLPTISLRLPTFARWSVYAAAVIIIIMFGVFKESNFIYFQF